MLHVMMKGPVTVMMEVFLLLFGSVPVLKRAGVKARGVWVSYWNWATCEGWRPWLGFTVFCKGCFKAEGTFVLAVFL